MKISYQYDLKSKSQFHKRFQITISNHFISNFTQRCRPDCFDFNFWWIRRTSRSKGNSPVAFCGD